MLPFLLLAGAAAAPHASAERQAFYYVASAGAWSSVPSELPVVRDTHPFGHFSFASPGRTFTLTVDDTGTLTGATIPVSVHDGRAWSRHCVPARTPTRLPGGKRGAEVLVFIDSVLDTDLRCSGTGTTGTAYVAS